MGPKGIFAAQIAKRIGIENPSALNLVGYLAESDLSFGEITANAPTGLNHGSQESFELSGELNGQAFTVIFTGPAARACYEKIRA